MTDYKEEQDNEIEALQSIYLDEFEYIQDSPNHSFTILLTSQDDNSESEIGSVSVTLGFTYVDKYPDVEPITEIVDSENMSEKDQETLLEYLKLEAKDCLGTAMIFTLASAAKEWIISRHDEMLSNEKMAKEAAEEAAIKRFEGNKVTVEMFLSWKAKFDEERLGEKKSEKIDGSTRRLTGRELFSIDKALNESDLKYLEELGGDSVEVDESLFENMEDLDLEELE